MAWYDLPGYDNWKMTDPRDYKPNPSDYWEYVDEDEMFKWVMDEYPNDFVEFLWDQEYFTGEMPTDENEEETYKAWENGDPELIRLLNKYFEDPDEQERLLRSLYPDIYE